MGAGFFYFIFRRIAAQADTRDLGFESGCRYARAGDEGGKSCGGGAWVVRGEVYVKRFPRARFFFGSKYTYTSCNVIIELYG